MLQKLHIKGRGGERRCSAHDVMTFSSASDQLFVHSVVLCLEQKC